METKQTNENIQNAVAFVTAIIDKDNMLKDREKEISQKPVSLRIERETINKAMAQFFGISEKDYTEKVITPLSKAMAFRGYNREVKSLLNSDLSILKKVL